MVKNASQKRKDEAYFTMFDNKITNQAQVKEITGTQLIIVVLVVVVVIYLSYLVGCHVLGTMH